MNKMKRPERPLYVAPALRFKTNIESQANKKYSKQKYVDKTDMEAYALMRQEISQRRTRNAVAWRPRSNSSSPSSNPKNTSDHWSKDNSSDFENSDNDIGELEKLKISPGTSEDELNDIWEKVKEKAPQDKYIVNQQTNSKIPNNNLIQPKDYSGMTSHSTQGYDSQAKETKFNGGLFDDYDDDTISDIEAVDDIYAGKRTVLTSTPNSDVVDEKILDAAKYIPEEASTLESTLLDQHDVQIAVDTNRNKGDYNFEIYHDDSTVEIPLAGPSKILDNTFIPPPVSPATFVSLLHPIHRMPSCVSSLPGVLRPVNSQYYPRIFTTLQQPRLPLSQSFQPYKQNPNNLHNLSSHLPSLCLQPGSNSERNESNIPFSNPPEPQEEMNRIPSPQEIILPHSPQKRISSPHLFHGRINPRYTYQESTDPPHLRDEKIDPPHSPQERIDFPNPRQKRIYPPRPLHERIDPPRPLQERIDPPRPLQTRIDPPRPLKKRIDRPLQESIDPPRPLHGRIDPPRPLQERIDPPRPLQARIDPQRPPPERMDRPSPLQARIDLPLQEKINHPYSIEEKKYPSCPIRESIITPRSLQVRRDPQYSSHNVFNALVLRPQSILNSESSGMDDSFLLPTPRPHSQIKSINDNYNLDWRQEGTNLK